MEEIIPTYCPACSNLLYERFIHEAIRIACLNCDYVYFKDPKVAVGGLVEDEEGRLLFTLRDHDPQMGMWALPSGFVDSGEELEQAIVREIREETGIETSVEFLLGVFSQVGNPVIYIVYCLHWVGGDLMAGSEAKEVRFFPADELPPPAFPSDTDIIKAWRNCRSFDQDNGRGNTIRTGRCSEIQ